MSIYFGRGYLDTRQRPIYYMNMRPWKGILMKALGREIFTRQLSGDDTSSEPPE
jgi:hypothetical protein